MPKSLLSHARIENIKYRYIGLFYNVIWNTIPDLGGASGVLPEPTGTDECIFLQLSQMCPKVGCYMRHYYSDKFKTRIILTVLLKIKENTPSGFKHSDGRRSQCKHQDSVGL